MCGAEQHGVHAENYPKEPTAEEIGGNYFFGKTKRYDDEKGLEEVQEVVIDVGGEIDATVQFLELDLDEENTNITPAVSEVINAHGATNIMNAPTQDAKLDHFMKLYAQTTPFFAQKCQKLHL